MHAIGKDPRIAHYMIVLRTSIASVNIVGLWGDWFCPFMTHFWVIYTDVSELGFDVLYYCIILSDI